MKKWIVYCSGNSEYILSPNKEPIRMLKSFQHYFKDKLDYIYFTDKDEPNLNQVENICKENGIKLVTGNCRQYYSSYNDYEYKQSGLKERWPDAHYWYCEAPLHLYEEYDFAIKCDGDMMCLKEFDLKTLESEKEITIAEAPKWYDPFDKYSPNAGFQIMNIKKYVQNQIYDYFRIASTRWDVFNSDTPALDFFVGTSQIIVDRLPADYNYLLFDIDEVKQLTMEDLLTVNIVHFVSSKPYNLNTQMKESIKDTLSKIYLKYE